MKKILYVIHHIPKCAGTTIKEHIITNLKKKRYLLLYARRRNFPDSKAYVEDIVKLMSQKEKDDLEIIMGHRTYSGIHELFKNRDVRYITFVRDPIKFYLSYYNYLLDISKNCETSPRSINKVGRHSVRDIKGRTFEEWFLSIIKKRSRMEITSLFYFFVSGHKSDINLRVVGDILKKMKQFYFIGLVENPEDFLFVYGLLGIDRLIEPVNVSKKRFVPENLDKLRKHILSVNNFDQRVYNTGVAINKTFKHENSEFKNVVNLVNSKQERRLKFSTTNLVGKVYKYVQKFHLR